MLLPVLSVSQLPESAAHTAEGLGQQDSSLGYGHHGLRRGKRGQLPPLDILYPSLEVGGVRCTKFKR